jgi:hypothetical protein
MSECILTQEVAYCDAIDMGQHECPICCTISTHKLGWYGVLCSKCKHEFTIGEDWRGSIAEKRRDLLGLTRRQMGNLVGVAGSKIARYETQKCPDAYWERTKELIVKREEDHA